MHIYLNTFPWPTTLFLWIPGQDGTRSKVTGNYLVNALHAFQRFNRRYHVKKDVYGWIYHYKIGGFRNNVISQIEQKNLRFSLSVNQHRVLHAT